MTCRVSIIIPVLNEASTLARTLRCLSILDPPPWEVLVVDGGSQDGTIAIAQAANLSILCSQKGRSVQMNRGAEAATGDVLCFLHADTLVPDDLVAVIDSTLAQPGVVAGGFVSLMSGKTITRWGFALMHVLKTYLMPLVFYPALFAQGLRLLFGDQVIFCDRQTFLQCSGFNSNLAIMEDADLCLKLVHYGNIRLVNRTVQSSDQRVAKRGTARAIVIYLAIGILWCLGVPATFLKRFYEEVR
jgi:rSAM/selenodomain-associated transferase 2